MFRLQKGLRLSRLLKTGPTLPRLSRNFGYTVILPEEPFVYGVSNITQRSVPQHILRPHYAGGSPTFPEDENGKVQLGGDAERRLRGAATLAKGIRNFAGTLAKVNVLFYFRNLHNKALRKASCYNE